jgi:hypothetical protein
MHSHQLDMIKAKYKHVTLSVLFLNTATPDYQGMDAEGK